MSYQDYSTQFVLDQFFTYINANQLGANCEHLADSFDVEHNWNIATPDGTHDWVAIANNHTDSTQSIASLGIWTPTAGVYQIVIPYSSSIDANRIVFEIYISGVWYGYDEAGANELPISPQGIFFCDGSNMRFSNLSAYTRALYYQKY